ncbi:uncharacterized protein LOC142557721 isoform X2 [Dermacentor variabilis]|uniref:uncharacterized protein LOC142557721 isoform X2 n=1 Tax=Dermacentor variabilis TaxID=34621 RepID=UPI003F5AE70D
MRTVIAASWNYVFQQRTSLEMLKGDRISRFALCDKGLTLTSSSVPDYSATTMDAYPILVILILGHLCQIQAATLHKPEKISRGKDFPASHG